MCLQFLSFYRSFGLVISTSFCLAGFFSTNSALAAQQINFKYQSLRESLSVQELSEFATAGKTSPKLEVYLKLSRVDPKQIRQTLANEVSISSAELEQYLNSWSGKLVLDEVSQIIQTGSGQANKQALRSALLLSTTKDNKFSLVEVFQNYPVEQVEIDIDRLIQTDRRINSLS